MDTPVRFVPVYEGDYLQAGRLKLLLEQAGVSACIPNEVSATLYPAFGRTRVEVAVQDLEKATPIVRDFTSIEVASRKSLDASSGVGTKKRTIVSVTFLLTFVVGLPGAIYMISRSQQRQLKQTRLPMQDKRSPQASVAVTADQKEAIKNLLTQGEFDKAADLTSSALGSQEQHAIVPPKEQSSP